MEKAIGYIRVSTEEQRHNYSIPAQKDAIIRLAEQEGAFIPEEYLIIDVSTGTNLDRPGIKRLRELIEVDPLIKKIYVLEPDRLSRKLVHLIILTEELQKKGIEIRFVLHPVDASPEGKLFLQLRGLFAEYEREKFLQRSKRGKLKRAQLGKVSLPCPPYGYSYIVGEGRLEIKEEEAEIVRKIFHWFLEEDLSTRGIAKRLTTLKILPPFKGKKWWNKTIVNILNNPVYGGTMFHNRIQWVESPVTKKKVNKTLRPPEEWIAVQVPSIVPKELIEEARQKLEQHKHYTGHPKRFYLLSGLGILFCQCGRAMAGAAKSFKYREYRYYRCNSGICTAYPISCCKTPLLPADIAEQKVIEEIQNLLLHPEIVIVALKQEIEKKEEEKRFLKEDLEAINKRLKQIDEERRELISWGLQKIFGERTREIIKAEAKKLEFEEAKLLSEKAEIEARLKANDLKKEIINIEDICWQAACNLIELPDEKKKEVVAALVKRIIWDGSTLKIHLIIPDTCPYPELKTLPK